MVINFNLFVSSYCGRRSSLIHKDRLISQERFAQSQIIHPPIDRIFCTQASQLHAVRKCSLTRHSVEKKSGLDYRILQGICLGRNGSELLHPGMQRYRQQSPAHSTIADMHLHLESVFYQPGKLEVSYTIIQRKMILDGRVSCVGSRILATRQSEMTQPPGEFPPSSASSF